jgi:hypothetical protein
MSLELHDEIKRVAHAIISEYVRSYPAMPHTGVLAKFAYRLELATMKLARVEGLPPNPLGPPEGQTKPLDGPIAEPADPNVPTQAPREDDSKQIWGWENSLDK